MERKHKSLFEPKVKVMQTLGLAIFTTESLATFSAAFTLETCVKYLAFITNTVSHSEL